MSRWFYHGTNVPDVFIRLFQDYKFYNKYMMGRTPLKLPWRAII